MHVDPQSDISPREHAPIRGDTSEAEVSQALSGAPPSVRKDLQ